METTTMQQFMPEVPISEIAESPSNPRKLFDSDALAKLSESVREHGVLQPVVVRRLEPGPGPEFELVVGHRRVRAARIAGLETVPAMLVEMTDAEVLEKQIAENIERADMSPIEEAEAFIALHRRFGMSVAEIAAKVSRSEAHVYQRMQLGELPEDARNAVAAGHLALTVALALARIGNPELRTRAAAEVLEERPRSFWDPDTREQVETVEHMTTEQALRFIRTRYTLRMDGATWDLASTDLVSKAGACSRCPKCSANTPLLFPELADEHALCSDPDCYAAKRQAAWERRKAELEAKGRRVLDGKEAEKVVGEFGPKLSSGYASANTICHDDPKGRTWGQLLGKAAEKLPIARDATGREHVLVTPEIIAAKREEILEKTKAARAEVDAEDEAAEFEGDVAHLTAELTVGACVESAEAVDADQAKLWNRCAELLLAAAEDNYDKTEVGHVAHRRGLIEEHAEDEAVGALLDVLCNPSTTPAQVRGLVLEMCAAMAKCFSTCGVGGGERALRAMAQDLGVKTKPLATEARRKVTAARKAAEQAKAAKKSGKGSGLTVADFELGDVVTYREGRGRFKAKVKKLEPKVGMVTVVREADGKIVERPAVRLEKGWVD